VAAELAHFQQQDAIAIQYLKHSALHYPQNDELELLDRITALAHNYSEYQIIIDLLENKPYAKVTSLFSLRLLDSLEKIGKHDRAYQIATPLYAPDNYQPIISQILLNHAVQERNWQNVYDLATNATKAEPIDMFFHAWAIASLLLQNKIEDATEYLTKLPPEITNPKTLFELLYNIFLYTESFNAEIIFEWAYQERSKDYNNIDIHLLYFNFFRNLTKLGYVEQRFTEVVANTCTILKPLVGEIPIAIILENENLTTRSFHHNSDVGQVLMNKKIGDEVLIDNVTYCISEIYSKYNFAFIDSAVKSKSNRVV
jgi:hypothetical protein